MYYEVEVDVPEQEFLIPFTVWVEDDEDPIAKIRSVVETKFPKYIVPNFSAELFE